VGVGAREGLASRSIVTGGWGALDARAGRGGRI
jgi:hypothetical protein